MPPKQFDPKSMREELRKRFWTVPSQKRCNASYKLDAEYFYHRFYALVGVQNEPTGKAILDDLLRRMRKPQSRVLVRQVLQECKRVTPGGILLPPGLIRVGYDPVRVQRIAIKVAQCLFYKDHPRFMPRKDCCHIRLHESPADVPEIFELLCQTEKQAVDPLLFCYWSAELDGLHYFAMIFWNTLMFCLVFRDPTALPPTDTPPVIENDACSPELLQRP